MCRNNPTINNGQYCLAGPFIKSNVKYLSGRLSYTDSLPLDLSPSTSADNAMSTHPRSSHLASPLPFGRSSRATLWRARVVVGERRIGVRWISPTNFTKLDCTLPIR